MLAPVTNCYGCWTSRRKHGGKSSRLYDSTDENYRAKCRCFLVKIMKMKVRSILLVLLCFSFQVELEAQFTFSTNNGAINITGYTGSNDVG